MTNCTCSFWWLLTSHGHLWRGLGCGNPRMRKASLRASSDARRLSSKTDIYPDLNCLLKDSISRRVTFSLLESSSALHNTIVQLRFECSTSLLPVSSLFLLSKTPFTARFAFNTAPIYFEKLCIAVTFLSEVRLALLAGM